MTKPPLKNQSNHEKKEPDGLSKQFIQKIINEMQAIQAVKPEST